MHTPESFRYDPTTRTVTRESDGEAMALVCADGVLSFTHPSRAKNYGADIRALLTAAFCRETLAVIEDAALRESVAAKLDAALARLESVA